MEILRIFWEISVPVAQVAGDGLSFAIQETSRAAMPLISDAGVILKKTLRNIVVTEGGVYLHFTGSEDYTDGAGNGLLSGRKELIMSVIGISQSSDMEISYAILYRLVKVTPGELVGLISS